MTQMPAIHRPASIQLDAVFMYAGRPLRVVRQVGDDPDALVIVEELTSWGISLKGQLAMWHVSAVMRALAVKAVP